MGTLKSNSAFVVKQIEQSNRDVLKRKLKDSTLKEINNFIVNIKRNDTSDYVFRLLGQIDLTEELKISCPKDLGDFIWNISTDPILSDNYSQIINSFDLREMIRESVLNDANHLLWNLFTISKEVPEIFNDEKILRDELKRGKGSTGEKLRLIGIFMSANLALTNKIVKELENVYLQLEIIRSGGALKKWFLEHMDPSKSKSFSVALALKGARITDEDWVFTFISDNFGTKEVIKCLETSEVKNGKSDSLIIEILDWLNDLRERKQPEGEAFTDLERAEYYSLKGEIHLRQKKFAEAKESFSETEKLFLSLNSMERAFDAAYRHIYAYNLEEEKEGEIDYETYFGVLKEFLERYKDLSAKKYQFHEKQIEYYKNKAKFLYEQRNFVEAYTFSKKAFECAERIYKKYPTEDFKRVRQRSRVVYWRAEANRLKNEQSPEYSKIAKCYEEAARNSEGYGTDNYKDWANCYKHKALAKPEEFFENIAKSVEFETKLGVEEVKNYLMDLKKEGIPIFSHIDNLAECIDNFLRIAKPDRLWDFLSLIIQSEAAYISFYKDENFEKARDLSRETYEDAEKIYREYQTEDIERMKLRNKVLYERARAKILEQEQEPDYRKIADYYENAARINDNYDKRESYEDWKKCYKHRCLALKEEPKQLFDAFTRSLTFLAESGNEKAKEYLGDLRQKYLRSLPEIVMGHYKKKELDEAYTLSTKIDEFLEEQYGENPPEDIEPVKLKNKTLRWRVHAELLLRETQLSPDYFDIADAYKKAAEVSEKYDERESYDDWGNCYKYKALAVKNRPERFLEYVSRAIEFANKAGDKRAEDYLEDLKQKRLVAFSRVGNFKVRIDNLKEAKEICRKNEDFKSAKLCELLYYYTLSNKAVKEEKFDVALKTLDKAIKIADKDVEFPIPNFFSSKDALEAEKYKLKGKVEWSRGNFSEVSKSFREVVKKEKDERERKHYEILKSCADILSKNEKDYLESDLEYLYEQQRYLKNNPLHSETSKIVNRLHIRVSSCLENISSLDLEKNKLEIIGAITGKSIAEELEYERELEKAVEEKQWLNRLPKILGRRIDEMYYELEVVGTRGELVKSKIQDFETFLENYLKIIIEFNAKLLWENKWKRHVEKYLEKKGREKDFYHFSIGDSAEILKLFKEEGIKRNKTDSNIKEWVLDALEEKHPSSRNITSHRIFSSGKYEPRELIDEILKIMYSLLPLFPLCLRIKGGPQHKEWYQAALIWGEPVPTSAEIWYSGKDNINIGEFYYINRTSIPEDREIKPEIITTATTLKDILKDTKEFEIRTDLQELTHVDKPEETPEDATGWLKEASSLYKEGNYEKTLGCLDECLNLEPENALALSNKGVVLDKLGYPDDAMKCFKDSLYIDRENFITWYRKGVLLHRLGSYKDAIICYDAALELAWWYDPAWSSKGDAFYLEGESKSGRERRERWEEAIKCYNKALEFDHENIFVLIKKGETLNRLERYEKALECFDTVLKLDPYNVIALHNKGFILGKKKSEEDRENALKYLDRVLEIDPEYELAWRDKAIILGKMRKSGEAITCFEKAIAYFSIEEKPDSKTELARLWAGMGGAFSDLKKQDKALECVDNALKLTNEDAFVWYLKGLVLSRMGRDKEAVTCFEEAVTLNPENAPSWNGKGEALDTLKDYEGALKCFSEAVKLNPKYIVALDNKGVVLSKMGGNERDENEAIKYKEEAIKCFDKILNELDPKYVSAWINKGLSLAKWGKPEEAIECYNKAIEIEPANVTAWNYKGRALEGVEEYEKAIECYDEALKILETTPDKNFTSDVWNNKGRAYENWGVGCVEVDRNEKDEKALECYENALEIKPDNAVARRNKVVVLKKLGRKPPSTPSRKILIDIVQELTKNPGSYELFRQNFDAKFSDDMKSKEKLKEKCDEIVSMSLKRATKDFPFETSAEIFESCQTLCEDVYGEKYKQSFTNLFNSRVIPRFRKIKRGDEYKIGPIESDEELKNLLKEFERTFGKLDVKIPLLEEIEEEIQNWLKRRESR